jgi:hypothetical protein
LPLSCPVRPTASPAHTRIEAIRLALVIVPS